MNNTAFYKLSYGLFLVTTKKGEKVNGSIVNTVIQLTTNPQQISITMNKSSYNHDLVMETKKAVVTVLSTTAPFEVFKHFGFQSGRDVDKFENPPCSYTLTEDGIPYMNTGACAYFVCEVKETIDVGTHTTFIAEVKEAEVISDSEIPMTYAFYQAVVKPKPQPKEEVKKGYRCTVCGYVYEGEPLPEDFICPWCKHGAADFEKIV